MTLSAVIRAVAALAVLAMSTGPARADSPAESFHHLPALGEGFAALGTQGVIAIYEEPQQRWTVSDPRRAYQGFRPASTFKIPGTLIALETAVAQDEMQVFKWDGKKRWMTDWNQDQTLQTAFRFSAVWVYQDIARRVGADGMQSRLWAWRYGNAVAGPRHDSFWLEGNLRITALEQIDFLRRFADHRLPISERSQAIARRVFLRDETPEWRLFAKTGWDGTGPVELGWFVGWTERKAGPGRCFFALNMDMKSSKPELKGDAMGMLGPQRERLVREALKAQACLD